MEKKKTNYNEEDYNNYRRLMLKTNALHRNNNPQSLYPKSSRSYKWNNILKDIWYNREEYEGKGLLLFRATLTRC